MKKQVFRAALTICCALMTRGQSIELISQSFNTATVSANGSSLGGVFSPDGKFILFSSSAPDLVNLPNKDQFNLYLLNTTNNSVQLVSAGPNGELGSGAAAGGMMSANNRFVVFESSSTNLVANDTNNATDIFIRDLTTGTTTLVSHNLNGTGPGNDVSEFPQISADGEWVVFQSNASNLTSNDGNQSRDVFAWKRSDNSIRLVSVGATGISTNIDLSDFSMTPDGRFVLFTAGGTNLVVANRASNSEVYRYDTTDGTTRWVSSVATNLPLKTPSSANATMSTDGRFVFLLASPLTGKGTLLRVDLNDNSVATLSTNIPAQPTYSESFGPSISDDGQFAAYATGTNIYYWSATSGQTAQVDVTVTQPPDGTSDTPVLSHDGKLVAFLSTSSGLVDGVTGGQAQIYVRDMVVGGTQLVTHSPTGDPTSGNEIASFAFNEDGTALLFDSGSNELVDGDNNDDYDVFTYDLAAGAISLVSASHSAAPSLTGAGSSNVGKSSVSADGRFVAFNSLASLTANDTNNAYDVYIFDRTLKTNILVSAGTNGFTMGFGASGLPKISADGTEVAFESSTAGLAGPTDTRLGTSIYVRDLPTGTITNISGAATGGTTLQAISADGRYVYFTSSTQLHRFDIVEQTDTLEATAGLGGFVGVSISADGGRVLYATAAPSTLYFHDYSQPSRIVVDSSNSKPMLSADGSLIAYFKTTFLLTTNIITGETNLFDSLPASTTTVMSGDGRIIAGQASAAGAAATQIWFLNLKTGNTNLVSRAFGQTTGGNGSSSAPAISADGRFIAFESWASDLVASDSNAQKDVFVYDVVTGQTTLISHAPGSVDGGNLSSFNPVFGTSDSTLLFISGASDLLTGDLNDNVDVFATTLDETIPNGDSDGDGLDDAWELAAFSTLSFGANDDPDGDGATNLEEFKAGTKPNDATSGFVLQMTPASALTFKTVTGHTYQVEERSDLQSGSWQPIGDPVNGDGSTANIQMLINGAQQYFRIRLTQ